MNLSPINHVDALCQRAQMVAPICSIFVLELAARGPSELAQRVRRDCGSSPLYERRHPIRIRPCLITDCSQFGDAILEGRVIQVGHSVLDGLVEPLQLRLGFRCPLPELGNMATTAFDPFLTPFQKVAQNAM
ncbi:hypothetical protein [Inquilinus sp. CA228]|uniref:hypothetical protein n=1 Tax=Inquilinus sp. CA228 TaxID=3455609 RepID=UPI003F8D2391